MEDGHVHYLRPFMGTGKMTRAGENVQQNQRIWAEKRARGTEGAWFPLGKRNGGKEGAWNPRDKKGGRVMGDMGEHDLWGRTWKRNNDRSSQDGRAIKWGRIVKREQGGDASKWDRIFKRGAEADTEEVSEMVAKLAEKTEEDDNSSVFYY